MINQHHVTIQTRGRSSIEITHTIQRVVTDCGIASGLCHVFLKHTSASLMVTENADSDVQLDLENYLSRLVPDGDPAYHHDQEGSDDMAAHIRSVLTQCEITLPIHDTRITLGTWQGIFLWEHRTRPHTRNIIVTLLS